MPRQEDAAEPLAAEPLAAELLATERVGTLQRLSGLEKELAGIIESSSSAGTDDEHDPEGATIAFERQHTAARPVTTSCITCASHR